MKFCVLGSGSRGNATYVESGSAALLIDSGFSGKELERRMAAIAASPARLAAILITHEHRDHVSGVGILARKYKLPIFANRNTFAAARAVIGEVPCFQEFETGRALDVGGFYVHPFTVSHDSAEPVGFVVSHNGCSLGYCTDTGEISRLITHRLSSCNGLIIESNHDPEMLKKGPYPLHLQQRVRSRTGHLANEDAASFVAGLVHDGLRHVVLAHLSEKNNDPALALDTAHAALDGLAQSCLPRVSLGWQHRVGEVVAL